MHFTTPRSPSFVTADSHHLRESAKSSRGIWRKEAVPAFDQPLLLAMRDNNHGNEVIVTEH